VNDFVYRLDGLAFRYPRAAADRFRLEIDVLDVRPGEILALVGPNGAGKTTLLSLLACLVRPSSGRLAFLGSDPWAGGGGDVPARRDAVLVTHHPYLFKGTVADNVAFGLRFRDIPDDERDARVREALAMVELGGWDSRSVSGLSAGQIQRVALARALALRPRALLLDEPTANLDAGLGTRMESVLRAIGGERGTTVVFSTHNFSQASRLADDILFLSDGRRVAFSHENCFSGTAETDGHKSWIEPKTGLRIVFPGVRRGHVTCVIDPAAIRVSPAGEAVSTPVGANAFRGRITRMETVDDTTALVRASGELPFRAALPARELEAGRIALYQEVLLRFEPESVRLVGERPADG
jgi:tungstate transport system ATP-binding protein